MVVPIVVTGGVVGPVVEQTSPVIAVSVAMLELVKVSDTTLKLAVDPSGGAVWAITPTETEREATSALPAQNARLTAPVFT